MQLLAARLAGVDRPRFYVFDEGGMAAFRTGVAHLGERLSTPASSAVRLQQLEARGYRWGTSDGN